MSQRVSLLSPCLPFFRHLVDPFYSPIVVSTSTLGTSLGTGGMETKIIAAELATGAGVTTVILNSLNIASIFPIIAAPTNGSVDESSLPQHTRFLSKENPLGESVASSPFFPFSLLVFLFLFLSPSLILSQPVSPAANGGSSTASTPPATSSSTKAPTRP